MYQTPFWNTTRCDVHLELAERVGLNLAIALSTFTADTYPGPLDATVATTEDPALRPVGSGSHWT